MEYKLEVSEGEQKIIIITAQTEEMLMEKMGKVENAVKEYELSKENNLSVCCGVEIKMGRCSECLEGV